MDTLAKLFGSKDIVKILRLFLLNPYTPRELSDIAAHTKVDSDVARTEITMLRSIGFVKKRSFFKDTVRKRGARTVPARKRVVGYVLNEEFLYLEPLRELLAGSRLVNPRTLTKKLAKAGRLKLVVLSGVFVQDFDGKIDLLLVGDKLRHHVLESAIRDIEADLGKELKYAAFATDDFLYRLSMRDRLVRDTLEFTHDTVVDRLGLEVQ